MKSTSENSAPQRVEAMRLLHIVDAEKGSAFVQILAAFEREVSLPGYVSRYMYHQHLAPTILVPLFLTPFAST